MPETEDDYIDCTPQPTILDSLKNSNLPNSHIVGELIDNAWDWGSHHVTVRFEERSMAIEDDGCGCIDVKKLLTLGAFHGKDRTGRFGVGMKQAAYSLGPDLHIDTAESGQRLTFDVHWPSFKWKQPRRRPVAYDGPSFMRLKISNADPGRIGKMKLREMRDKVRQMYYPALKAGCTISYDGELLEPFDFPPLNSRLVRDGEFQGRRYRLTAGLFRTPQRLWPYGFTIAFRNRLMVTGLKDVYGEYDPHGLFADLELFEDADSIWPLNTNKDGIANQVELAESLFPVIEPLLQRAQTQHENVADHNLISKIEADLNAMLGGKPRKARRAQAQARGGKRKEPTGTHASHSRAAKIQPEQGGIDAGCGPGTNGRCTGYRITFDQFLGPEIATVDLGKNFTYIRFWRNHPAVQQWRRMQDHRHLLIQAHSLILARQRMGGSKQMIIQFDDPFTDYIHELSESAARTYSLARAS